jgi:cytochrome b
MVLLGDVHQVEARFSPFGDSVNLGVRYMHGLWQIHHGQENNFGHTPWYSMVMYANWKLVSFRLEIVLVSTQDRCMVCTERTIDLEIIFGTSIGTPRWRRSSGSSFQSI